MSALFLPPNLYPFPLGSILHFRQLILMGISVSISLTAEVDLIEILLSGQSDQFRDRYMAQARGWSLSQDL